ncbi:hypothetical protein [Agromyces sp. CCNWLW203]|uniref:hypothetical protein n=1 Tax=Agromyces sp. CCNWLW203 TaxID=3112842 RepID=UPI002F966E09
MDWPRLIVIVLYALGLVLPLSGAWLVFRHAKATIATQVRKSAIFNRLRDDWHAATAELRTTGIHGAELSDATNRVNAEYDAKFKSEGLVTPNYENVGKETSDDIVARAFQLVSDGNSRSAWLVAAGLALGTVASIVALYLPPPA